MSCSHVDFLFRTGGEKVSQPTEVAYNRCPQKVSRRMHWQSYIVNLANVALKILKFYEAHLK